MATQILSKRKNLMLSLVGIFSAPVFVFVFCVGVLFVQFVTACAMRPILLWCIVFRVSTGLEIGLQWNFDLFLKKKTVKKIAHEHELQELLNSNFELTLVTTLTNDKYPMSHAPLYVN